MTNQSKKKFGKDKPFKSILKENFEKEDMTIFDRVKVFF